MAFFKRKPKIVDLTEHYKKQQEKIQAMNEEAKEDQSTSGAFEFLGNLASSAGSVSTESSGYIDVSKDVGDKRKKLAKRLIDLTNKVEDLSNQIYHLQQRIELLERKLDVSRYG